MNDCGEWALFLQGKKKRENKSLRCGEAKIGGQEFMRS
jgi:hypothetical protein